MKSIPQLQAALVATSARRNAVNLAPRSATGVVEAGALFGNRRELLIDHAGALYRLRITRSNKLILTK